MDWPPRMSKAQLCAGAQKLAAQWYREAREAFEIGDLEKAIERQRWARFRAKCARSELDVVLESNRRFNHSDQA